MGQVQGLVVGACGEASEPLHSLIFHLATSRVRVSGPQLGKRGQPRTEVAEMAINTAFLRRTLSVCAVRGQASTLLGRLEVLGPGTAAAAQRRNTALQLERVWGNQRRAHALTVTQGRALVRRGQFKLD